jgi:ubiquinone biosynthesis monooxygenase Coq7
MDSYQPKPVPPRPGLGALGRETAEALRVDHAGELAAVNIYRGQQAVLSRAAGKSVLAETFGEMKAQEAVHLAAFDDLLTREGVRPSLLTPLWRTAGFALGAATALMGEKAAHACTEAVESVIEQHYAEQALALGGREPELAARIEQFRAEEMEHHDHAVGAGSREAPGHRLLSAVIRAGCRAAIKVAEKI